MQTASPYFHIVCTSLLGHSQDQKVGQNDHDLNKQKSGVGTGREKTVVIGLNEVYPIESKTATNKILKDS